MLRVLSHLAGRAIRLLCQAASAVFQHEFDHVQGVVFIDRVESTRELVTEKEYQRRLQSHA